MAIFGPLDPLRALSALQSGAARLGRSAYADHTTINERSLRTYSGVMTHAFLHAAVAPSRRIRPRNTDHLVERAAALAAAFGLPTVPYLADADSQTFAQEDDGGSRVRSLLVTRSGVLEMLWALQQMPTDDGAWAVRAVDACAQLARFIRIVGSDDYGYLLGDPRWLGLRHARIDWTLGVTTTTAGNAGQRGWRDIVMVGPQPDRASGHVYGFMPPSGYSAGKLRGVKRSLGSEQILRMMLEEWLRANGYLRTSDAVSRTVEAAMDASAGYPSRR
ncbi:MAG TPA: hypothetical protein VEJ23_10125 [Solirubrobacteraceae bacterium]|nr:hypothetical protein [Solirubrobacteraceae bacterium]